MIYLYSLIQILSAAIGFYALLGLTFLSSSNARENLCVFIICAVIFYMLHILRSKIDYEAELESIESKPMIDHKENNLFPPASDNKEKIAAAIFALLFGGLGVHKFYLGYHREGLITLSISIIGVFFMFIPTLIMGAIAFTEFLIYVTKSDQDFQNIYVIGRRSWL